MSPVLAVRFGLLLGCVTPVADAQKESLQTLPLEESKRWAGAMAVGWEQEEAVGVQWESQTVVQAHSKEETRLVLNQAERYASGEPYDKV